MLGNFVRLIPQGIYTDPIPLLVQFLHSYLCLQLPFNKVLLIRFPTHPLIRFDSCVIDYQPLSSISVPHCCCERCTFQALGFLMVGLYSRTFFPLKSISAPDCLFALVNVLMLPKFSTLVGRVSSQHRIPFVRPQYQMIANPPPRELLGLNWEGSICYQYNLPDGVLSALDEMGLNELIKLFVETMNNCPSHKTFKFGNDVEISSDFDSGNLFAAEKASSSSFNIWIGTDSVQNNYRTWFYFCVKGFAKSTYLSFTVKNMHNQTKLLNQGLVPVYREGESSEWRRVSNPVKNIGFNGDGYLQFTFGQLIEADTVYFAFFYPWSISDNTHLLDSLQQQASTIGGIYFHRTTLIYSLEKRPVELVAISSEAKITKQCEFIDDQLLFPNKNSPKVFFKKKCMFISARVHPGQVPSSHVMNGILKNLVNGSAQSKILLDNFVFYIVPIINPDGVFRGNYRADPNGVNLNRYYQNPSATEHSPIYGIRKLILHLQKTDRLFGCLDLHAHAVRKGAFIYGNYSTELKTQLDICLFPKILSLNSKIFEYEGSNFTQKNMYCKDKKDSISKQGSARVALFKMTKNPYFWTLECNYNMGKFDNKITPKNTSGHYEMVDPNNFDAELITNYQYLQTTPSKEFYTIEAYEQLGKDILDSLLDLINCHPHSRINHPQSKFKSVENLKLNLLVALMRMTPFHFQGEYRKLLLSVKSEKPHIVQRSIRILYEIFIKNQVVDIDEYMKNGPKPKNELRIKKRPSSITQRVSTKNQSKQLEEKEQSKEREWTQKTEQTSVQIVRKNQIILNFTSYGQSQYIKQMRQMRVNKEQVQQGMSHKAIKIVNIGVERQDKRSVSKNNKLIQKLLKVGSRSRGRDKASTFLIQQVKN